MLYDLLFFDMTYGMMSKLNFIDMLQIKGNKLWLRSVTPTFPVHELSAFDISAEKVELSMNIHEGKG